MTSSSNILLVDDDVASINVLRKILVSIGDLRYARSGPDALRLARDEVPDLVLLDVDMPGMSGFDVCRSMKNDLTLRDTPIIFITSNDGYDQEVTGLSLGAADFIGKPLRPALVEARVRVQLTMMAMSGALRAAAATDPLTGLSNRRRFEAALASEWAHMSRSGAPLSVLMIDVDYFKMFNDHYGHLAGDRCLTTVARAMRKAMLRGTDLLARYGGEEFVALLPDTPTAGARMVADRLIACVDSATVPHARSCVSAYLTASVGAATFVPDAHRERADTNPNEQPTTAIDLVHAADQALYAAKRAGRHRAHCTTISDLDAAASEPFEHEPPIELAPYHA